MNNRVKKNSCADFRQRLKTHRCCFSFFKNVVLSFSFLSIKTAVSKILGRFNRGDIVFFLLMFYIYIFHFTFFGSKSVNFMTMKTRKSAVLPLRLWGTENVAPSCAKAISPSNTYCKHFRSPLLNKGTHHSYSTQQWICTTPLYTFPTHEVVSRT